jgi:WD40 repeat protein
LNVPCNLWFTVNWKSDFGFWNPDEKQVAKEKVGSKILSAAWSPDGSILAIGMQTGTVSIRNHSGEEINRIERRAPVWCISFIPGGAAAGSGGASSSKSATAAQSITLDGDTLAIGCWDKTLSMYRYKTVNKACFLLHLMVIAPFLSSFSAHCTRIQGSSQRLTVEKTLRFYPCGMAIAGSSGSRSAANASHNHLVRTP